MTFYRRIIHTTRLDFHIPADVRGASWSEVYKAVSAATRELENAGRRTGEIMDDAIRIWPSDDEIIVSVELEQEVVSTQGVS
jgi:hypothetical protein